jgi:hypothetical protein
MNGTRTTIPNALADAFFWPKVDTSGGMNACWPWAGGINKVTGYGMFHPPRSAVGLPHTISAHRYAAAALGIVDLKDPTQHVDHTCHNGTGCAPGPCAHRACCNPLHHKRTGNAENVNNSHNANKWKTHCPRDHEYTPENTRTQAKGNTISRSCIACERERDRNRAPRAPRRSA